MAITLRTTKGSPLSYTEMDTNFSELGYNGGAWVDVRSYGAHCDGVTDDTSHVQAAITAMTSGGTLLIPGMCAISGTDSGGGFNNGVYLTNDNITIMGLNNQTCGFTWIGARAGNMFRSVGANVGDGIYTNGIRFTNLLFQGIAAQFDMGSGSSTPMLIHKFNDYTVDNCVFKGFSGVGGAYVGLSSGELSRRFNFLHNVVDGDGVVPMTGITMYNVDGFNISDNTFISISESVKMESSNPSASTKLNNGIVSRNIIRNGTVCTNSNSNTFMAFGAQVTAGNEAAYILFDSNEIYDSTGSTGTNVTGAFIFIGASTDKGNVHHITISNNIFNRHTPTTGSATDFGVYLHDVDHFSVTGNIFGNPLASGGSWGIYLEDARYTTVVGNKIDGTNWSQSIQEVASAACFNLISDNNCTNDSGSTFSDITTSKSTISHDNRSTGRRQIWANGVYMLRMEAGVLYDATGGTIRSSDLTARGSSSIADMGNIAHTLGSTPAWVDLTGTVSNQIVSVAALSSTNIQVAIKKHDNSAGTTQTVYWRASL